MRPPDLRWTLAAVANLLLLWLTGLANHHLASAWFPFRDHFTGHLYLGGLFVTFSALRLDSRNGWIAVTVTGLLADAMTPVPFGTSVVLLGLAYAALLHGRQRFPRDEPLFGTVVALFTNLFLFLALSFFLVGANPSPARAWVRLLTDLVLSQLAIALVTPWFLALQSRGFELVRVHPETGRRVARADY
ncbi:MAG TPA: hypothetical protein VEB66_05360 [Opitutaceae bacterium]|nr:hypothetical protein [Opitutaceae bacterium]